MKNSLLDKLANCDYASIHDLLPKAPADCTLEDLKVLDKYSIFLCGIEYGRRFTDPEELVKEKRSALAWLFKQAEKQKPTEEAKKK